MPRETAPALQRRVPVLYYDQSRAPKDIADILGVSLSTVYLMLRNIKTYGTPHNPLVHTRGPKPMLNTDHLEFLNKQLVKHPVLYLDELQALLRSEYDLLVSLPTLSRALGQLNFSHIRVTKIAAERNELVRLGFKHLVGQVIQHPDQALFLDESSKDEKTFERRYGYAKRGSRCEWEFPFVRGRRLSLVAALSTKGVTASKVYDGAVDADRFLGFLRDYVLPNTTPYPGPRSVLVLDNCSIHHTPEVRHLVEVEAECKLLFLPPYSPDLNPIEEAFSSIKAWLRRHATGDLGRNAPVASLHAACDAITPKMAQGWFRNCGYI